MDRYRLLYSSDYYADIGEGHVFPIKKFELVRDILLVEGTISADTIIEPKPAAYEDLTLVHTNDYIDRLTNGELTKGEIRKLGLPWSASLVQRSYLAVSGTVEAAKYALKTGVSSNLAGGTHHSFPDRGEGFCVLNDVAVASRVLKRDRLASRFLIVDCDVHQGNATAFIFADDSEVFTFSMHGAKNYPLHKEVSDLDIELPDNTDDRVYLDTLREAMSRIIQHEPDLIFYLAGADPFKKDKLGRLGVSKHGLLRRDEFVLTLAKEEHIPIVTVMSGGYAKDIEDTVEIHCNTIRAVRNVFFPGALAQGIEK
jgi:acetoin utilization deacetylase AcuC-like enzyme